MWNDTIRLEEFAPAEPAQRHVLFITNMWPDETRPYYGSFVVSQAKSLVKFGIAVDVLYVRGYLGTHAYLKAFLSLPSWARAKKYDLVHIHYGHTAAVGVRIRQRPLIISFCGEDLLGAPRQDGITLKSRIEVSAFRQLARLATATITKSKEMESVLPAGLRSKNHVLPNGVDLGVFSPASQEDARAELGWPSNERVMLFLGNPDDPRKNVTLAKEAASLVAEQLPFTRLHIAWGVSPAQVPYLMNAADCLTFPSKSEGSPNAVKEAMACALPIVATPVGDIPELLKGVENCYVRDPSPRAFADALLQVLVSGRAPMARVAIRRLGIDVVAGKLLEIYGAAAGSDWKPAPDLEVSAA